MNKLILATVAMALCVCASPAFADGYNFSDSFAGNTLNATTWAYTSGSPVVNNGLFVPNGDWVIGAVPTFDSDDGNTTFVVVANLTSYMWSGASLFFGEPPQLGCGGHVDNRLVTAGVSDEVDLIINICGNSPDFTIPLGNYANAFHTYKIVYSNFSGVFDVYVDGTEIVADQTEPAFADNGWNGYVGFYGDIQVANMTSYVGEAPNETEEPPVLAPSTGISGTLTDVGAGLGNFISAIQSPVVNFVLVLGIIGGILSIFMAVAFVIKKALFR